MSCHTTYTDEHPAGTSSVLKHMFFFLWQQVDTVELFKQNFIHVL